MAGPPSDVPRPLCSSMCQKLWEKREGVRSLWLLSMYVCVGFVLVESCLLIWCDCGAPGQKLYYPGWARETHSLSFVTFSHRRQ